MPFLDRLTNIAQSAVDSTKGMLETSKLTSDIGVERTKISELKGKLGAYYYARYAAGDPLEEEPAGLCAGIKACEDKIASIEAEIQAKKDEAQKAAQAAQPTQDQQAATVSCPVCGTVNPAASKFCRDCGGKLEPPAPADKPLFCTECGAQNPPGTKFCGGCGAKI